jgi:membrane protein implicated in regulation of membrane protease activity
MKHNEAGWDRGVRVVLGLGLLSLTMVGPETPLGWLGLVPLVTGLWGFCPLYQVLGLSTCRVQK